MPDTDTERPEDVRVHTHTSAEGIRQRRDVADVITDGRNLGHSDDVIASAILVVLVNPSEA